jgi:hypothetical protein
LPRRCLVGDVAGRTIAVEVRAECHHLMARIKDLTLSQSFLEISFRVSISSWPVRP